MSYKKDFLPECNEQKLMSPDEFQDNWCRFCKNTACSRSVWGESKWWDRMSTQEERLLTNPRFAQESDPTFQQIRAIHFKDMIQQAIQLDIADRRGDWEIPEIPVLDGRDEIAKPKVTNVVDQAVAELAKAQGKSAPQLTEPSPPQSSAPISKPQPQKVQPQVPTTQVNTPMPSQGLMVGGPAPNQNPHRSQIQPKQTLHDPWEIPVEDKKVEIGAKIRLMVEEADKEDE